MLFQKDFTSSDTTGFTCADVCKVIDFPIEDRIHIPRQPTFTLYLHLCPDGPRVDLHDQNKVTVAQRPSGDLNSVIIEETNEEEAFIYFSVTLE